MRRLKKWARENMTGLAAVTIAMAGILTTIVMTGRKTLKKGAQSLSKFGKAVANIAKKLGPVIAALGNLLVKIFDLGAKGIMFLSQNLWLLALALTYFVCNEYKDRKKTETERIIIHIIKENDYAEGSDDRTLRHGSPYSRSNGNIFRQ